MLAPVARRVVVAGARPHPSQVASACDLRAMRLARGFPTVWRMDPAVALARVPRRPPRGDLVLVAAVGVWAFVEALTVDGPGPRGARVAFALAVTLPLVLRRRMPFAVMAWI